MNHYKARERSMGEHAGRWDFTCENRRTGIYAVGYCGGWLWDAAHGTLLSSDEFTAAKAEAEKAREKYHDDGHATAADAIACYRTYLLDSTLSLDNAYAHDWHVCVECARELRIALALPADADLSTFESHRCAKCGASHTSVFHDVESTNAEIRMSAHRFVGEPVVRAILTNRYARIANSATVDLCDRHRTRAVVESHYVFSGESYSSY